MNSNQRIRARIVFILLLVAAGVIVSTLYIRQIVEGADYSSKAASQYVKPLASIFDRGFIYFNTKDNTHVAAAKISIGNNLYLNPKILINPNQAFEAVSQYVPLNKAEFISKAEKTNDVYEVIAHKLDDKSASLIKGLNIKGVSTAKESWRSYPGDSLASHEIGLVGEDKDGFVKGRYGLESYYDDFLSRPNEANSASLFAELFSGIRNSVFGSQGGTSKQADIVTTIEPTVEKKLETVLSDTKSTWHSDEIGGIVIDPNTGEIIAMSSLPSFDPNDLSKLSDASILSNSQVEHVYEMGSIMKPLTLAIGLDSGSIDTNFVYNDTGTMTLNGKKIANYDGKARGMTGLQQILSQSLNIGAASVALKAGAATMAKYFKSFGLGDKTGIDQPNEAKGIVGNLSSGREIEIATASYGQGVAISPVSMARALAVLPSGGYLIKPHLVKEIDYLDGRVDKIPEDKGSPVLKKATVDDITSMLVKVVDEALKKGAIKMEHYSIAAKTGTAQIPDHVNGGYYSDRYLHSFFGYFPAYQPKFLVFLYQIYPKNAQYASETLTDPFADMTKFLISYYNIPPDR